MTALIVDTRTSAFRLPDTVRPWLRAEGAAALLAGIAVYGSLGGEWLWFLPLLLVPDVSMIGYAAGARAGAFAYNLVHNWALGLALVGAGLAADVPVLTFAGAIVVAHVGMDRLFGYGLKHPEGFKDTHLQRA
jgi:hypothetical protein